MALDFLRRAGRDREQYGDRVPPNQRVSEGWPVLTYDATPRVDLNDWKFIIAGEVEEEVTFTWEEFNALPQATIDSKWVRGLLFIDHERPGFWEQYGYNIHGEPWKEERYS